MEISFDTKKGHLKVSTLIITPATKPDEIQPVFELGEEQIVGVVNKQVPCRFANCSFEKEGLRFNLSLRFERNVLVSFYLDIGDLDKSVQDAAEYYGNIDERVDLHLKWLRSITGRHVYEQNNYGWGTIGVGKDRSGGVFIFMHNKNNEWAF